MAGSSHPHRLLVLLPVLALIALGLAAAARGAVVRQLDADSVRSVEDFWTKKRMRQATPMPASRLDPGAARRSLAPRALSSGAGGGGARPEFIPGQPPTIGPLADSPPPLFARPKFRSGPVPLPLYGTYPFSANGRLFQQFGKKLASCSATVVPSRGHRVILTAGHCVHDRKLGYASKVAFVPAYANGLQPRGFWVGDRVATTRQWVRRRNEKYDYAAIRTVGAQGPVGSVVGEVGLNINASRRQRVLALGYPSNLGGSQFMWACASPTIGADPFNRGAGPRTQAIGCDMSYGASGGGWETVHRGKFFLNSVTSYFYPARRFENILFGPYLTRKVRGVVASANG